MTHVKLTAGSNDPAVTLLSVTVPNHPGSGTVSSYSRTAEGGNSTTPVAATGGSGLMAIALMS